MLKMLSLSLLPALLLGQGTTCGLTGTIVDSAGASIAGVRVLLTGEGNGFVRSAISTSQGFFSFPDLTPATFTVAIDAPGFKAYRQTKLAISSGEQRSLGTVRLEVGHTGETISVTAEVVSVDLNSAEKGGTLTGDQLEHMALRGRDVFDAISLLPGVVDTSDGRDAPGPGSIGNIYIMGGRNDSKNMMVDGVSNLDTGSNGSVHSMPSMDSIAEVKVLASAYGAEHGRNPSAISIITKGGGKQFHGAVGAYVKNEAFNANDYFAKLANRPRTPYRYNIFNYTLSGPIVIPKFHTVRNKLFFFWNQEFQNQLVQYGVRTVTVPTALERSGDFSKSYNTNGSPITIRDPENGRTPFPGQVIPPSRLNPIGINILNIFPMPNYVDPNPSRVYQWNHYESASGLYPRRTETLRVDYSPRDNWQLYVSLSNNADSQNAPYGSWVAGNLNFQLTPIVFNQPGKLGSIHSTNTINPTMFNEMTVAASQNTLTYYPRDYEKLDRTKLGINIVQRNPANNPNNIIPDMTFSSIQNAANPSLSSGLPYFNQNTIYHFTDNLSKIWHKHTFRTGIYFENTLKVQSANALTRGSLNFGVDATNALDSNNSYSNALLGNYLTYAEATARPQGRFVFTNTELYVQDAWRVRRNLMLDYGVRFYHDPPQYEQNGQLASFVPSLYSAANAPLLLRPQLVNGVKYAVDPRNGKTYPSGLVGAFTPGVGDPAVGTVVGGKNGVPDGLYTTAPMAIAPRFGFAWDPFGTMKTSVRGGGGIFFDRIQGNPVMGQISNPPTIFTPTQYYGTFADIQASAASGLLSPNGSVTSLAGRGHQQAIYNFSLSVQRQVARTNIVEVGYVGSLGRHLLWQRNINPVPLGSTTAIDGQLIHPENHDPSVTNPVTALPANFMRPYQGLGDVLQYEFAGASNYHGMLASFAHRFSKGFSVNLSYTFSKALDTADSYSNQVDAFVSPKSRNYGPAGFDRRQVLSANFYMNLPKVKKSVDSKTLRLITNGWQLSGVFRWMSGGAFTPSYSLINGLPTPTGSVSEGARVQVLDANAPIQTRFGPAPQPTAANPSPQIGNLGKNTFIGPGTDNVDLTLSRTFKVTERVISTFRFESYNTLNHPQFSGVDSTMRFDSSGAQVNALFNQVTVARPSRRLQLALQIRF